MQGGLVVVTRAESEWTGPVGSWEMMGTRGPAGLSLRLGG